MSSNARQYYSLLYIVYRYGGFWVIFNSERGNFVTGAGPVRVSYTNYIINFNYVKCTCFLGMF